jgi:hypothetical protein
MLPYTKRLLIGVALLLAAGAPLRAEVFWSYYTDNTSLANGTTFIPADNTATTNGGIVLSNPGTAVTPVNVHDSTLITLTNPTTSGLLAGTNTANFSSGGGYDLKLSITYNGVTMSKDVTGQFTGWYDNENSNLHHHFTSPTTLLYNFSNATFSVNVFDPDGLTFNSLPPPPGAGQGTINAYVTLFGGGTIGGGPGNQTPEPSTLLLSCLGLMALGGAAWRKRRQQLALAA